jgi:hypothetical protein
MTSSKQRISARSWGVRDAWSAAKYASAITSSGDGSCRRSMRFIAAAADDSIRPRIRLWLEGADEFLREIVLRFFAASCRGTAG